MIIGCRDLLNKYGSRLAVFMALRNGELNSRDERYALDIIAGYEEVLTAQASGHGILPAAAIPPPVVRSEARAKADERAPRRIRI